MDGLFSALKNKITSEDFRQESLEDSVCDFTRKRKISFIGLISLLLGFTGRGVQIELNRFIDYLQQEGLCISSITKSAFSQARQKLKSTALQKLHRKLLSYFDTSAPLQQNWQGLQPVAIDGSTLLLHNNAALQGHFGMSKNQHGSLCASARTSVAYDICNKLILDAVISPLAQGEVQLATMHLEHLVPGKHLLVFDRGYPSIQFIKQLCGSGYQFCFRLSRAWKEAYRLLDDCEDATWVLPPNYVYKHKGKEYRLSHSLSLRVVKIILSSGQTEVLLTNVNAGFSVEKLKELYAMRWSVEECYQKMKQVAQIEYFSGRTIKAVEQDFYARVLMINITALMETQILRTEIEQQNKDSKNIRRKQKTDTNSKSIEPPFMP